MRFPSSFFLFLQFLAYIEKWLLIAEMDSCTKFIHQYHNSIIAAILSSVIMLICISETIATISITSLLKMLALSLPLLLSSLFYSFYIQDWNGVSCHNVTTFINSIIRISRITRIFFAKVLVLEPISFHSAILRIFRTFIFYIVYFRAIVFLFTNSSSSSICRCFEVTPK